MYARAGRAEERSERHARSVQKNKRKARASLYVDKRLLGICGACGTAEFHSNRSVVITI